MEDGLTKIDVSDETVWLTREQMAERFQRDRSVIGKHIKNEGELRKESVLLITRLGTERKNDRTIQQLFKGSEVDQAKSGTNREKMRALAGYTEDVVQTRIF